MHLPRQDQDNILAVYAKTVSSGVLFLLHITLKKKNNIKNIAQTSFTHNKKWHFMNKFFKKYYTSAIKNYND